MHVLFVEYGDAAILMPVIGDTPNVQVPDGIYLLLVDDGESRTVRRVLVKR